MARTPRLIVLKCCLWALLLLPTYSAAGQDALGRGNALDANTRQGSGGANARARNFAAELRYRNAIVTGNAPGGFSFRGDVGYRAAGEFRGALGSDDLFAFQRDTYLSSMLSVGGRALRSSDALMFQMQLNTTGSTDLGYAPLVSRSAGSGSSVSGMRFDPATNPALAQYSARPGALRSTSAFVTGDALSPTVLRAGNRNDGAGRYLVVSPLGAVQEQTAFQTSRLSSRVTPRGKDEVTEDDSLRVSGRVEQPESASMLERLRRHYELEDEEPIGGARETLQEKVNRIREEMGLTRDGDDGQGEQDDSAVEDSPFRVETLVDPHQDSESFFRTHMKTGQDLLVEGRWFLAEERFSAALRITPGDTLASIGRAHAQLGAGLFRSAVLSLRAVLAAHPEILGVRFDASLLPDERRLEMLIGSFREASGGNTRYDRDAAFLMAYLGWQHDRVEYIVEAFVQIERLNDVLDNTDPLYELARELWLSAPQD